MESQSTPVVHDEIKMKCFIIHKYTHNQLGVLGNWLLTSRSYMKPQSRIYIKAIRTYIAVSSYHLSHTPQLEWVLIVCCMMQYSYSLKSLDPFSCRGIIAWEAITPLHKQRICLRKTTIQLTSYGMTRGNGLQFHPVASIDQMNLLVACWLKHYMCCTGQLASQLLSMQPIEFTINTLNNKKLFSFEALFSQLVIHQILLLFFRKENFRQETFSKSHPICQDFLPPKLCIVLYQPILLCTKAYHGIGP